jgi:peptidoglycan/LPS O-acetylase OafA/YrhL
MFEVRPGEGLTSKPAYPREIQPLISLGFIALAWIILNQFRLHLGLQAGDRSGLVFKGYLGAQLYFVLGGFLASHRWMTDRAAGRLRYGRLLWTRLSQVYPLHVAMIALMAVLVAAASAIFGAAPRGVFDLRGLIANLALAQAWGATPTVTWNFPSWLISAEWLALLGFPAIAWFALGRRCPPWLIIAAAWLAFNAGSLLAGAAGVLFTDMTAQFGALQTIPAFLMGAGLYALGRETTLPGGWARTVAALAGAWILTASLLRLSDLMIWPAFGALVFGLAETAKTPAPALTWPPLPSLGRIAISVYLVYLPVDIVYFHLAERLIPHPAGAVAWTIWAGVFPVILAAGIAAHALIAAPAGAWLAAHRPLRDPVAEAGRFRERLQAAAQGRSAPWRGLPAGEPALARPALHQH